MHHLDLDAGPSVCAGRYERYSALSDRVQTSSRLSSDRTKRNGNRSEEKVRPGSYCRWGSELGMDEAVASTNISLLKRAEPRTKNQRSNNGTRSRGCTNTPYVRPACAPAAHCASRPARSRLRRPRDDPPASPTTPLTLSALNEREQRQRQ
ncbi:hypothetical protein EVAR_33434_1 [Eumeta japonica]|uniref:Uncharacterized protein n=1 Tax=Eumeta variegata TaxID=151549 RepID=A0A4C1W0F1_EUMVA|nr:hypothetical protein EVAR_33434_1 [Eumeta japonica]